MKKKIDYRCPECGSYSMVIDACADWDWKAQEWRLCGVNDVVTCQDCGYEDHTGRSEIPMKARRK